MNQNTLNTLVLVLSILVAALSGVLEVLSSGGVLTTAIVTGLIAALNVVLQYRTATGSASQGRFSKALWG